MALGHGCFRRSAGFGVGGNGIVWDRETSVVTGYDIGSAVTMLEADVGSTTVVGVGMMDETDVGWSRHGALGEHRPGRLWYTIDTHATAGDRGERGSASSTGFGGAAPSASCLRGGVLARHGRRALLGASFRPFLYYYVVRCIVNASRTAATA